MLNSVDEAKERFKDIFLTSNFKECKIEKLSESDTRCKIIDIIIKDILGWKEINIEREPRVSETGSYIDYILSLTHPYIVVEAKKTSIDFLLPNRSSSKREYRAGGVLSESKDLVNAMHQAKGYAVSKGVDYCCVSNGLQFVFFRSQNNQGIEWKDYNVIVFWDHNDIYNAFEVFYNLLGFEYVASGSLNKSLALTEKLNEKQKKFKRIELTHYAYSRTRDRNRLFPIMGDVIKKVFQDLSNDGSDPEILRNCYVSTPRDSSYKGIEGSSLKDHYYLDFKTEELKINKKNAGHFQERIESTLRNKKDCSEVILLLGGVGSGKTTFIHRFRKVLAKDIIDNDGIWIYINFKPYSDTGEKLLFWVCDEIIRIMGDEYDFMKIESWSFLKQAYHAEYEKLKNGLLAPIYKKSQDEFDQKFSDHIGKCIEDKQQHVVKVLKNASSLNQRRLFLVFDNADQLGEKTQNEIFLIAQKFSDQVQCSCIISLREESYWKNRDAGPLNAFHSIAYHVQSPHVNQVIARRLSYVAKLIRENIILQTELLESASTTSDEIEFVFDRLTMTLLGKDKRYTDFIEHVSANDMRRALEYVARFLYSGHTNIDSLIRAIKNRNFDITIGYHEFLTAIILADQEYYSEKKSDIVNLFALEGYSDASHFNRIALLKRLSLSRNEVSEVGIGYVQIQQIIDECEGYGIMADTANSILILLNTRRLLETETKIKEDLNKSLYVRINSSGIYYICNLIYDFSYLECMLIDTPISNQDYWDLINQLTIEIGEISSKRDPQSRYKRLELRIYRVDLFLEYLKIEFSGVTFVKGEKFKGTDIVELMEKVKSGFDLQKVAILENAKNVFNFVK